jgi:hypothetical protein
MTSRSALSETEDAVGLKGRLPGYADRATRGSGSSVGKTYSKNPLESTPQVVFGSRIAKDVAFVCLLREIFAYNRIATAKMVQRAHISRNKPGV